MYQVRGVVLKKIKYRITVTLRFEYRVHTSTDAPAKSPRLPMRVFEIKYISEDYMQLMR